MSIELSLAVSPEQDRLLQELVETYTTTVGSLLQKGQPLPTCKELNSNLKRAHLKNRAISDAWIIFNRPETPIELPSFRMNSCSYRITRENILVFKAFIFKGIVDFWFEIQLHGNRIPKDEQGVLTLIKDGHRGWVVRIEPKKNPIKKKDKFKFKDDLYPSIIW